MASSITCGKPECTIPMVLGQPCNGGCCCRFIPPAPIPLEPPCFSPPFPTYYKPRPRCPRTCDTPPCCWCPPCQAPPPCCRPGAYNPRYHPPGVCPPPCCCQPCKFPPRCMPPPCQSCKRPCCPPPVLLPIPAYAPKNCPKFICEYPPATIAPPREPCKVQSEKITEEKTGDDKKSTSVKYKSMNIHVKITDETRATPEPY